MRSSDSVTSRAVETLDRIVRIHVLSTESRVCETIRTQIKVLCVFAMTNRSQVKQELAVSSVHRTSQIYLHFDILDKGG